jgi:uncharacterized membrane protein
MKKLLKHLKTYIFRGLLAIIPLGLCYLVIRLIYLTVDQRVTELIEKVIGFKIPGLGIALVLVILYLLGLVASNWFGRQFFNLIERISRRIPLIKTIYSLGKQLGAALSHPEKQAFKRAVMVEQFRRGLWSIAFVTGTIMDKKSGEKMLKLFVPSAPNPTTGFTVFVRESEVRDLPWSLPEAMDVIISGGIISPPDID